MSLADRITAPATTEPTVTPKSIDTTKETAKSWADELASPTGPAPVAATPENPENPTDIEESQVDGGAINGSGFEEGDYEVEISLEALQEDQSADNPLFGMNKSFPDLLQYIVHSRNVYFK